MAKQNTVLVGLQYGDEGKGKFSHYLSKEHDVFVRYQGGGNAGHTIYHNGQKVVTHYLPVGIVESHITCILGNGMVINPVDLLEEIKEVSSIIGEPLEVLISRIAISNKAHVVTQDRLDLDVEREKTQNIGTTKTGIGPTYEAKYNRTGLTMGRAIQEDLFPEFNALMGSRVTNTEILVNELDDAGLSILFEGAQGVLLDIDFGQFPYVTSSNCIPGAVRTGAGFTGNIDRVVGVFKPYVTRVGTGPFVTAMDDNTDRLVRMAGYEFGATTGRNRYCAYLDLYALKYACRVAGITELAVAKMDVLDWEYASDAPLVTSRGTTTGIPEGNQFTMGEAQLEYIKLDSGSAFSFAGARFQEIPVCVGYSLDGKILNDLMDFPFGNEWERVEPIYDTLPGWSYGDNSQESHSLFLQGVERYTGVPVSTVSFGPRPEETYRTEQNRVNSDN
jgi:adenylosuccinate synthase